MSPLLMLPGPTPIPPEVQTALLKAPINHRSEAWKDLFKEVESGLKWAYQTENEVLMLAGSGTTAMEAAIVNSLSPGDRIISLVNGSFGQRFGDLAEAFGIQVDRLSWPWGDYICLEALESQLQKNTYQAVLMVHNETSTGILNPLEAIAQLCKKYSALSIVDAISSLTTVPLPVDQWELDIVLSASQKSYMCPPGMAFISMSEKAWHANQRATCPRYTLDLKLAQEYALQGLNPWTPPIAHYWGLQAAFKLLQAEGLSQIQNRHFNYMQTIRQGAQKLGFTPFIRDETQASRSVTPLLAPPGLCAEQIPIQLWNEYQIAVGSGQRQLAGQLFRIGHLGYQSQENLAQVLKALAELLKQTTNQGESL